VDTPGKYRIVLDSDSAEFGGTNRLDVNTDFFTHQDGWGGRRHSMMVTFLLSAPLLCPYLHLCV